MTVTAQQTGHSDTPLSAEIWPIPSRLVGDVWGLCAPLLKPAVQLSSGRMTLESVKSHLQESNFQLWCVIRDDTVLACVVTKVSRFPQVKCCVILYAGGNDLDAWMDDILDSIEAWAVANDCDILEVNGRRGWVRKLKGHGFKEISATVEKRLK